MTFQRQRRTTDRPGTMERWIISGNGEQWKQCHGSTLAQASASGAISVAWFAGTREGSDDNAIWFTRGHLAGDWQTPRRLLHGHAGAWWNPVLSYGPDGRLWLFAKNGPRISHWKTWYITSDDDGMTWSAERELVPGDDGGGRGPVKNPPLLTRDGLWVAPNSIESEDDEPVWDCRFDISADRGRTWSLTTVPINHESLRGSGIIQPTLWSSRNGPGTAEELVALCRSTEGCAYRTVSKDGGLNWCEAQPVGLPQNNSGFCAVSLDEWGSKVAIAHNPGSQSWGSRCPLVISVSSDGGVSWDQREVVEDGEDIPAMPAGSRVPKVGIETGQRPSSMLQASDRGIVTNGLREFSYPTMVLSASGELLLSYTWHRRGIVLARISKGTTESWL